MTRTIRHDRRLPLPFLLFLFHTVSSCNDASRPPVGPADLGTALSDGPAIEGPGGSDFAASTCVPPGIFKGPCPFGSSTKITCPAGQLCKAFKTCVTPGCSDAAECKVQPPKSGCFRAWPQAPPPTAPTKEVSFTTKAAFSSESGSPRLVLGDAKTGFWVRWSLPSGMKVPIAAGDTVKVEACPSGTIINTSWVVAVHDVAGKLLLMGGQGINVSASPCLQRVVKTVRQSLSCRPHKTPMDTVSSGYTEAFALSFASDKGPVSVAMGQRKTFTLGGRQLEATVCDARHPMEWQATDIYGSLEGFVVVSR